MMKQLLAATLCGVLLLSASAKADRVTYSSPPSSGGGTPVTFVGNTAGSANTYTLASPTPTGFTLTDQYVVCGSISATNTGASTLAVSGTSATAIKKQTPAGFAVLTGGELVLGNQYCFQYNATGTTYVILNNLGGGVSQAATSTTVTSGQWANWQVFDIQAASQTLTLPVVTSLPTNGGILIKTEGNPVTLTPNAADGINGGTVGASVTIPANYMTVVTTSGTSGTTALSAPLGLVAGSNITLTQNSNGTTTVAASGGGGITCPTGFTAVRGDCVWTISAPTTTGCGAINCWAWTGLTTDKFSLRCHGVLGGNSTASFAIQVGEGGTPTWQTGAAAYTYVQSATQANGSAVLTQSGTNLGFPGPYQPPTSGPTNVDLEYLIQDMASTTLDVSTVYRTVNAPGGVFTYVTGYAYFNADNLAKTAIRVIDGQGTPVSAAGGTCTLVALGS